MTGTGPAQWMPAGTWPDGTIVDGAPAAVTVAANAARILHATVAAEGLDTLADRAGVDPVALRAVVDGEQWPDLGILATLEQTLEVSLWP